MHFLKTLNNEMKAKVKQNIKNSRIQKRQIKEHHKLFIENLMNRTQVKDTLQIR